MTLGRANDANKALPPPAALFNPWMKIQVRLQITLISRVSMRMLRIALRHHCRWSQNIATSFKGASMKRATRRSSLLHHVWPAG
jgi:hypothetical protein